MKKDMDLMGNKVLKGFLAFTVVFFFVVVGLAGFNVVTKRHQNAPIAEEDKTLVAPDPQKIQRMLDKIVYNIDLTEKEKVNIRQGITALFKACPRIVNLASDKFSLRVTDAQAFVEWFDTKAHIMLLLDLKPNNMDALPERLRSENGFAEYALMGGNESGVLMIWPFSRWLCKVSSEMTNDEMQFAHEKKRVPFIDLMTFVPLKEIPPNSF